MIRRHNHLKIGRYHQHLHEILDMEKNPIEYMMSQFPELKERDEVRKIIGELYDPQSSGFGSCVSVFHS